jgi:hypothetical protein
MPPVLEQHAKARLITDAPHHKAVSVTLRYDGDDPLAVRIVFPPEVSLDDSEVVWAFARELLDEGLRGPAGHGDVQIWPCGRAQTVLEFRAPEGVAVVQFDTTPLRRFLKSSYAMVAPEQESRDVAAEVERRTGSLLI